MSETKKQVMIKACSATVKEKMYMPNWKWECTAYLSKNYGDEMPEYLKIRAGFTDTNRMSNLGYWGVFDAYVETISDTQFTGLVTFPERGYFHWKGTIDAFQKLLHKSKGEVHEVLQDSRLHFFRH
jgi:hypothetical protein